MVQSVAAAAVVTYVHTTKAAFGATVSSSPIVMLLGHEDGMHFKEDDRTDAPRSSGS